jgi:signal peptidase I
VSWRFGDPQRGDIVVFHPPFAGPVLIKRIIGLPGDEVSVSGGHLSINGSRLVEPYLRVVRGEPVPTEAFANGMPWSLQRPYTVPAGSYFVMGDNRTDSGDSREFGPVPRAQLVGRAFARYWPPSRIGGVGTP